jgi:AbiV family abortive infection protein
VTVVGIEELQKILAARRESMEEFLEQYQGNLSFEQIYEGISVCIQNAASLCNDSKLLLDHERWSRSFSLSISALEEIGKVVILHSMVEIPSSKQKVWAQHWREARRHTAKALYGETQIWHDRLYAQLGAQMSPEDLEQKVLERLRQGGLYIDFSAKENRWQTPNEVVQEMATKQYERAIKSVMRVKYYQERGLFELPLLQRRAEICRPIYDNHAEIPKQGTQRSLFFVALLNLRERFFNELVDQGILDRFTPC